MSSTTLVTVSRKDENNEKNHKNLINEQIPFEFKDIDKMIVMSGTATRESEKNENKVQTQNENFGILNNCRINFSKLRVPLTKNRKRRFQEKTINKSCEMLFEYIKPYHKVVIEKKTEITQSHQFTRILKKDEITFKKKATRKVQFFSVCEENPESFSFINEQMIEMEQNRDENLNPAKESKSFQMTNIFGSKPKKTKPIASSEDFIKTVFKQH